MGSMVLRYHYFVGNMGVEKRKVYTLAMIKGGFLQEQNLSPRPGISHGMV